jgi:hypothetical protein
MAASASDKIERPAAMWNLTGNDVEQAKEQLKGRRAAIKARYDEEMKRVDDELAAIEKFERYAQEFVSQYKGDEAPSEAAPGDEQAAEEPAPSATAEAEPAEAEKPVEEPVAAREAKAAEAAAEPTSSSRWRARLNGGSATQAA